MDSAFEGCSGLTSVMIPASVTEIGRSAFEDCVNLQSINIPRFVKTIGYCICSNCKKLESILYEAEELSRVKDREEYYDDDYYFEEVNYDCYNYSQNDSEHDEYYADDSNLDDDEFEYIDDVVESFFGCDSVCNFIFGENVKRIPNCLCRGMIHLNKVDMPESVTEIGRFAFSNCRGLTSVEIPESVTEIGDYAFRGCSGLTTV